MRTIVSITLILLTHLSYQAFAANFYISPNGDDSNSGLSPNQAWQTLSHLNNNIGATQPGDSVLFERGGVYRGFVQMWKSGTPGNPITFSAYGSGPMPEMNAGKELINWTNVGGDVWKAHCASCTDDVTNLFIDDVFKPIGRYPNPDAGNAGYLSIDVAGGNNEITDLDLNAPSNGYWDNAEVVVRSNRWVIDRVRVQWQWGGTVHFSNHTTYELSDGYGYFFQDHIKTLDRNGEWFYDNANKDMYLYLSGDNPNNHEVEISYEVANLLLGSQDYLAVTGLYFTGSREIAVQANHCDHLVFTHNKIYGSGKNAAWFHDCHNLTFEYNDIRRSNNNGLNINLSNNGMVRYNTITQNSMVPGMGQSGDGAYNAVRISGDYTQLSYNRIDSAGYLGIRFEGSHNLIHRNHITYSCMVKDDGAAIYTWNDGGAPFVGNEVSENIILYAPGAKEGTPHNRGIGMGIYLDDRSQDVLIKANTVAHVSDNGIFIHNSKDIHILDNVVLNSGENQLLMQHDVIAGPGAIIRNCIIDGNTFVSQSDDQYCMKLRSMQGDVDDFGIYGNNGQVNPFDSLTIKRGENTSYPFGSVISQHYPLKEWSQEYGHGSGSFSTPVHYPAYEVKDTVGQEMISNSIFPFGTTDWSCWGNFNNNCNLTWDPGKLDAGALKMQFSQVNGNSYVEAYHYLGLIERDKIYHLKFSGISTTDGKRIEIRCQKDGPPYTPVFHPISLPIEGSRKEYELFIQPEYSESSTNLIIRIYEETQVAWFDNVSMHEVSLDTIADGFMELLTNPSTQPIQVSLSKSYLDPNGSEHCGTVTVQPYKSVILMEKIAPETGVIYDDVPNVLANTLQLYGCDWFHYVDNASRVMTSVNTSGQYLNDTGLDTYINQGPIRAISGKYTTNRSWVLSSLIPPTRDMTIRLYATKAEVDLLISKDPNVNSEDDIGVSRFFTQQTSHLNGNFSDNQGGNHEYYSPQEVIARPYKNGYYFEVVVDELGEFWLSNGALTASASFPVEFSSFTATLLTNTLAELEWTTASEQNSSHFLVQRSVDKNAWEEVGKVKAAGNSEVELSYRHEDLVSYSGLIYYRIREVDLDGSETFSPIVSLLFGQDDIKISLKASPIPAKDILNVTHLGPGDTSMELILMNAIGQHMQAKTLLPGEQTSQLDVSKLIPGLYYLQLINGRESIAKKIFVNP